MTFEAVFLLGYANVLLLAALGLHRLGRVNPSPWAGRVLAGHRQRHGPDVGPDVGPPTLPPADPPDGVPARPPSPRAGSWPHIEQPRVHTAIAIVATVAALVLVAAEAVRHRGGLDLALGAVTAVAASAVLVRLGRALRSLKGDQGKQ